MFGGVWLRWEGKVVGKGAGGCTYTVCKCKYHTDETVSGVGGWGEGGGIRYDIVDTL
jgi:hypothetical protein